MQLEGATPLELKVHNTLLRVESELPASELATTIAVSLSEAASELQRQRGHCPPRPATKTFSERNRARCEDPLGFNHRLDSWSLADWMMATMGELGEAANYGKKLNRVRDGIPGNDEPEDALRQHLYDELADTFTYLDLMCQSLGIDLMAAVESKFARVSLRMGYAG